MSELIIDKIRQRKESIKKKTEEINSKPLVLLISENENLEILDILREHNVKISYVCR